MHPNLIAQLREMKATGGQPLLLEVGDGDGGAGRSDGVAERAGAAVGIGGFDGEGCSGGGAGRAAQDTRRSQRGPGGQRAAGDGVGVRCGSAAGSDGLRVGRAYSRRGQRGR